MRPKDYLGLEKRLSLVISHVIYAFLEDLFNLLTCREEQMLKQVIGMEVLGVVYFFFLLMLQDAVVRAQLPSPSQSTGFCESFVSPTIYKCTEEVVSTNQLFHLNYKYLFNLCFHCSKLLSSYPSQEFYMWIIFSGPN